MVKLEAGRWQRVMESEDGQTQAAKAGKTFCSLFALGVEESGVGRLSPACHRQGEGSRVGDVKQTKLIGGFILATCLLVLFPVSIKYIQENKPRWDRVKELKEKKAREQKAWVEVARANEEKRAVEQKAEADAEINELVKKNHRIADIYETILETAVRQPTRPLGDAYQLVLEWHYLWLEVRDTIFWRSKPVERAEMDRIITQLVSATNRDKNLRDLLAR
jgi:hypothetical protein